MAGWALERGVAAVSARRKAVRSMEGRGRKVTIMIRMRASMGESDQGGDADSSADVTMLKVYQMGGECNSAFGAIGHLPFHFLYQDLNRVDVTALMVKAHVFMDTPLRDTLSREAHEFVWCQEEPDCGVLILSEFSGSAQSLRAAAICVNPWDTTAFADAIQEAIEMEFQDRRELHLYGQKHVFEHTQRRWAANFLDEIVTAERECEDERLQIPPPLDHDHPVAALRKASRRIFVFGFSGTLLPRKSKIQAKLLPKLHPVLFGNHRSPYNPFLLSESRLAARMAGTKRKSPDSPPPGPGDSGDRWVCFIRHAQALHNVCDDNLWTPDNPLTAEGESQCAAAHTEWGAKVFGDADLIVVSPMTRALQTAYLIGGLKAEDPRILVSPMCAEHLSGATCDEGRSLEELRKELPWAMGWRGLAELEEEWWKAQRPEEPLRAAAFLDFLRARTESRIVVVSHGAFLGYIVGYHMDNAKKHMMNPDEVQESKKSCQRSCFNIGFAVCNEYEDAPLKILAKAPLTCLQGLGRKKASMIATLGPKTVSDLASWKFARWAEAIVILGPNEQDGNRDVSKLQRKMNINKALDKEWEGWAMSFLLDAPPSAFAGLTPAKDPVFKSIGINNIKDLGEWKYYRWARAICTLAEVESENGAS
ncbi:TPS3 [Symbiodinium sp. CCMP2592]|nr:TPS3 [Symbiodinium sp. CCMP2592]